MPVFMNLSLVKEFKMIPLNKNKCNEILSKLRTLQEMDYKGFNYIPVRVNEDYSWDNLVIDVDGLIK